MIIVTDREELILDPEMSLLDKVGTMTIGVMDEIQVSVC